MTPGARRDLVIGGAVVAVGVGLFAFAIFGDDDGFRAPRWVVAAVALSFIGSGALPLRGHIAAGDFMPRGTYPNAAASAVLAVIALASVWMMVAVGPEGVALDVPISLPHDFEHGLRTVIFYGVFGVLSVVGLVGSLYTFGKALPALGHTAVVAVSAPMIGLLAWVAIQIHNEKSAPATVPAIEASFDDRFPGGEYLARMHGDEVFARPGRYGTGLWVGGSGDWVEIEAPRGFDTRSGLTMEVWIKRESWVNPYIKGRPIQTVATVELEREYQGHPEITQVSLSLELLAPRGTSPNERYPVADTYKFKPLARVGEVRVAPVGTMKIEANRWTHLAVVYDRFLFDRMRLYLDGRLVARAMAWDGAPGFADIRRVRLGTGSERNGAYRGMIDELKVFARPLSDDEIAAEGAGTARAAS
jgi:Concanavalin A-like lectin/glucanases superfamily